MIGRPPHGRPTDLDIDPRELTEDGQQTVTRTAERTSHIYHHNGPTPPRKRVNVSRNAKGLYTWEMTLEMVGASDADIVSGLRTLNDEIAKAFGPRYEQPSPASNPAWESGE